MTQKRKQEWQTLQQSSENSLMSHS